MDYFPTINVYNCFHFSVHSVHLYYLFPSLEEGGLATYRTAIVQNQHLAMLAKVNSPPPAHNESSVCR